MDKSTAIAVLRKSKPKAMLAKLMQLFPEVSPPPPQSLPPLPEPVAVKIEPETQPSFDLEAWKASVNRRVAARTAASTSRGHAPPAQHNAAENDLPLLDRYVMGIDETVVQTETTWEFSADAPAITGRSLLSEDGGGSGGSLFGAGAN